MPHLQIEGTQIAYTTAKTERSFCIWNKSLFTCTHI